MDRRPDLPPGSGNNIPAGILNPSINPNISPAGSDNEIASVEYGVRRVSILEAVTSSLPEGEHRPAGFSFHQMYYQDDIESEDQMFGSGGFASTQAGEYQDTSGIDWMSKFNEALSAAEESAAEESAAEEPGAEEPGAEEPDAEKQLAKYLVDLPIESRSVEKLGHMQRTLQFSEKLSNKCRDLCLDILKGLQAELEKDNVPSSREEAPYSQVAESEPQGAMGGIGISDLPPEERRAPAFSLGPKRDSVVTQGPSEDFQKEILMLKNGGPSHFWSFVESTRMTLEEVTFVRNNLPDCTTKQRKKTLGGRISRLAKMPIGSLEENTPTQRHQQKVRTQEIDSDGYSQGAERDPQMAEYIRIQAREGLAHVDPEGTEKRMFQGKTREEFATHIKVTMINASPDSPVRQADDTVPKATPVVKFPCRNCDPETKHEEIFMRAPCHHAMYCSTHVSVDSECDYVEKSGQRPCGQKVKSSIQIWLA